MATPVYERLQDDHEEEEAAVSQAAAAAATTPCNVWQPQSLTGYAASAACSGTGSESSSNSSWQLLSTGEGVTAAGTTAGATAAASQLSGPDSKYLGINQLEVDEMSDTESLAR